MVGRLLFAILKSSRTLACYDLDDPASVIRWTYKLPDRNGIWYLPSYEIRDVTAVGCSVLSLVLNNSDQMFVLLIITSISLTKYMSLYSIVFKFHVRRDAQGDLNEFELRNKYEYRCDGQNLMVWDIQGDWVLHAGEVEETCLLHYPTSRVCVLRREQVRNNVRERAL